MAHAVDETGDFTLTGQTLRYTSAPRYDVDLIKWKEDYCREHKLKAKDLEGYGECPDEILYPYALYDADVTWRICHKHMENLDCDAFGNCSWEAFWISQRAVLAVLEISTVGIPLDKKRVDDMTITYMEAKSKLEQKIKDWANWPELNMNSVYQVRELLFGTRYNGKNMVEGVRPRLRPPEAKSLEAMPILTTDKRPKRWTEVIEVTESPITDTHRATLQFHDSGITIVSGPEKLRFREQDEIRAALDSAGFDIVDIRDAPDRPDREWVFVATKRD